MDMSKEDTDRARWVTEQIKVWIENDGAHVEEAKANARAERGGAYRGLATYCQRLVHLARKGEAAWHVQRELAPNDWPRVNWDDVADSLLSE